jgi:retron-type reverse transcriptase
MKRIKGCFPQICTPQNLFSAYRRARKGSRREVAAYEMDLELNLFNLRQSLSAGNYTHGAYRQRTIYERKPRLISAAPFRDRVVHHALMQVIDPMLDPTMINDSYACRQHKGVHLAVDRYQQYAKRYTWVLKLDIASYFASIDHHVLTQLLQKRIGDQQVLKLFNTIISSYSTAPGKGLPIGNLTSQFLANYYLNEFDHWLKESLRVPGYLRYVDDFFLFGDNKETLWCWLAKIELFLESLSLHLHPNKTHLRRTSERVDVLGYIVTSDRRWLRNDNGWRFTRRLRNLARLRQGAIITFDQLNGHVYSWIGHARHGETMGLRRQIFSNQRI